MNRLAAVAVGALSLALVAAYSHGGWAVVTITDAPDYLAAGSPTELTFQVRAHGREPIGRLHPQLEARSGRTRVAARVSETSERGTYRATFTVPTPGQWTVRIDADFGRSRGETLPWRAVAAGAHAPTMSEPERGRQLFAARGCVSCHVHRSVDVQGEANTTGPELTDKRFAAQYLAAFLADPSIKPQAPNGMRMPNLGLSSREIGALVAFINQPGAQVTSR
ncbi:MAG TPA: c-type cytochrome [Gemmatimonadaceae bacterium]|nr:c-type cytochrome [Gemmatimonadaceae bacterium]